MLHLGESGGQITSEPEMLIIPWSPRFQPAADLGGEFVRRDLNPLQMKSMTSEARLEGLTFWEQGMMAKEC